MAEEEKDNSEAAEEKGTMNPQGVKALLVVAGPTVPVAPMKRGSSL